MYNISRGLTLGSYLRGFSNHPHRGVDAEQHGCKTTEYENSDSPLPPLENVMYCVRVSLRKVNIFLAQHFREGGRG
jgi:hypothetical protein